MGKKRRLSFRLEDDEAVVIAPTTFWEHVAIVYRAYAQDYTGKEKESWIEAAAYVEEWVENTKFKVEPEDEF